MVEVREGGYYRTREQMEMGLKPMGPMIRHGNLFASGPLGAPVWDARGAAHAPNYKDIVEEYAPPHPVEDYGLGDMKGDVRSSEGRKDDQTKPPLHLIAPDFLYAIADILDFGQKKYAPRNWEKGMDWSRVYRAAIGHLFDWFMRKGPDPETGKSHLWHAACCVMFLVCYEIRNAGTDDRP